MSKRASKLAASVSDAPVNDSAKVARIKIPLSELVVPPVAWPTVALFATATAVALLVTKAMTARTINPVLAVFINAVMYFILVRVRVRHVLTRWSQFTPMHDAAHRSVAKEKRWLNELVGHGCAFFFTAPFGVFRWVHLQHHKYTNDVDKDPDMWTARRPIFLTPLRWVSMELHYYTAFLRAVVAGKTWTPLQVAGHLAELALFLCVNVWFARSFSVTTWLLCFELPKRIAILFLAYTFDYLPHRPHTGKTPMSDTAKLGGIFSHNKAGSGAEYLDFVLLYQNYHNVHHLWMHIPFYQYSQLWHKYRNEFLQHGTPITHVYDAEQRWN